MTNHRSDSQSKLTDAAKVVRLVDVKSARKEATPPSEGIRPTKEGPWDPCRFQEYEVSPEFRLQIMTAKPPPADPELFEESLQQTYSSDPVPSDIPNEMLGMAATDFELAEPHLESNQAGDTNLIESPADMLISDAEPRTQAPVKVTLAPSVAKRSTQIKLLVAAGALLGLLIGSSVARSKRHQSESAAGTSSTPAHSTELATPVPTPANSVRADSPRISASGSSEASTPTIEPEKPPTLAKHPLNASPTSRIGTASKRALPKATPSTAEDSDPAWVEPK